MNHKVASPPFRPSPPLLTLLALTLLFLLAAPLPAWHFFSAPSSYLILHNLVEIASVAVSASVFMVGWQLAQGKDGQAASLLACAFLAAALFDLAHLLSFPGMPDFITPSSTEKAILFWLAGRYAIAIGLLVATHEPSCRVAGRGRMPLLITLLACALLSWLIFAYGAFLPRTFIPGSGLTPFKIGAEYLLAGLLLWGAWRFLRRPSSLGDGHWLAAACATQALAELFFTLYAQATDMFNLLGHLYKIAACLMVYRGLLVVWYHGPLRALERERAHLKTLLTSLPHLIWLKDQHGVYISCNRMFERFFGSSEAQIIGRTDYDFVDREQADFFRANDQRTLDANQPTVNEEWLTFRDNGYEGLFETTKTPIRNADGELIGVLGIAHDITQHRQDEEYLRIAATAFESQEGMLVAGASHAILRVNHALCAITGYTPGELIGNTPEYLYAPRQPRLTREEITHATASGQPWSGEVWLRRKNGEEFPAWLTITAIQGADSSEIRHYIHTLLDFSERKRAEEEIHQLAFYDPLTNLPNRRLLLDRLSQWQGISRRHHSFNALLLIDLDNFKTLNDALGHDAGDAFLRSVARRLLDNVRSTDTVARLGGDEFVAILTDLGNSPEEAASQTELIGKKLLTALARPYECGQIRHHSSASIGATLFCNSSNSPDDLLKQADLAMYSAKEAGRNTLCFFDLEMQTRALARAVLESELSRAIHQEEFVLHYQPQLSEGEHIVGAEALLRWQHPERGVVSPGEIIAIAEESRLILPIGHWVLREACKQLASWQHAPALGSLKLSVNVSLKQIANPAFVEEVQAILQDSGANPRHLQLELTESIFADDVETLIARMQAIKALGVSFSLDDFGTGYSSLSLLQRLPLDQLKIDRSFVRDITTSPNAAAIARTIVALGDTLGLNVLAEGVETEAQRHYLAQIGCRHWQGYLFDTPQPLQSFEARVRLNTRKTAV